MVALLTVSQEWPPAMAKGLQGIADAFRNLPRKNAQALSIKGDLYVMGTRVDTDKLYGEDAQWVTTEKCDLRLFSSRTALNQPQKLSSFSALQKVVTAAATSPRLEKAADAAILAIESYGMKVRRPDWAVSVTTKQHGTDNQSPALHIAREVAGQDASLTEVEGALMWFLKVGDIKQSKDYEGVTDDELAAYKKKLQSEVEGEEFTTAKAEAMLWTKCMKEVRDMPRQKAEYCACMDLHTQAGSSKTEARCMLGWKITPLYDWENSAGKGEEQQAPQDGSNKTQQEDSNTQTAKQLQKRLFGEHDEEADHEYHEEEVTIGEEANSKDGDERTEGAGTEELSEAKPREGMEQQEEEEEAPTALQLLQGRKAEMRQQVGESMLFPQQTHEYTSRMTVRNKLLHHVRDNPEDKDLISNIRHHNPMEWEDAVEQAFEEQFEAIKRSAAKGVTTADKLRRAVEAESQMHQTILVAITERGYEDLMRDVKSRRTQQQVIRAERAKEAGVPPPPGYEWQRDSAGGLIATKIPQQAIEEAAQLDPDNLIHKTVIIAVKNLTYDQQMGLVQRYDEKTERYVVTLMTENKIGTFRSTALTVITEQEALIAIATTTATGKPPSKYENDPIKSQGTSTPKPKQHKEQQETAQQEENEATEGETDKGHAAASLAKSQTTQAADKGLTPELVEGLYQCMDTRSIGDDILSDVKRVPMLHRALYYASRPHRRVKWYT